MSQISTYIWGIRFGFKAGEAIYPEKDRLDSDKLREYEIVTRNFNEKKDTFFRLCSKDFYFTARDEQYRYYSLVIANHTDIAGRKAFLVLTLMCGRNKIITGDIISALQNLKVLYKTKNADNTIDRNLFTQDHVNQQIAILEIADAGSKTMPSNTLITFMEGNFHADYFNQIGGDEVYFIPEGSNSDMIANMGFQRTIRLEDEIQKTTERQKYKSDFLALWQAKNEQDLVQLKELYSKCKDVLDAATIKDFTDWEKNTNSNNRLNAAAAQIRSELEIAQKNNFSGDPTKCLELLNQNKELRNHLKNEEEQLKKWEQTHHKRAEQELLIKINIELDSVKHSQGKKDPAIAENLIDKLPKNDRSHDSIREELKKWKNKYKQNQAADLKHEIQMLSIEIKKSSRKQKLNNENAWKKKISELKNKATILGDLTVLSSDEFKFLISDAWKPAKLPVLKLAVAAVVLCIIGGGIYLYKFSTSEGNNDKKSATANKNEGVANDSSSQASDDYNELLNKTDQCIKSGEDKFNSKKDYVGASVEFKKALEMAEKAKSADYTATDKKLSQNKIDIAQNWIHKCDSTIGAKSNTTEGSKSSTPKVGSNGQKDGSTSGSAGEKRTVDPDKYWAEQSKYIKNKRFNKDVEKATQIISDAPKKDDKESLLRPLKKENYAILDTIYEFKKRNNSNNFENDIKNVFSEYKNFKYFTSEGDPTTELNPDKAKEIWNKLKKYHKIKPADIKGKRLKRQFEAVKAKAK